MSATDIVQIHIKVHIVITIDAGTLELEMPYVKIDVLGYSSRTFSKNPLVKPPNPLSMEVII